MFGDGVIILTKGSYMRIILPLLVMCWTFSVGAFDAETVKKAESLLKTVEESHEKGATDRWSVVEAKVFLLDMKKAAGFIELEKYCLEAVPLIKSLEEVAFKRLEMGMGTVNEAIGRVYNATNAKFACK